MVTGTRSAKKEKLWSESAGAGDRDGAFLGLSGHLGAAVAMAGAILLMTLCPAVVIYVYANSLDIMLLSSRVCVEWTMRPCLNRHGPKAAPVHLQVCDQQRVWRQRHSLLL